MLSLLPPLLLFAAAHAAIRYALMPDFAALIDCLFLLI